MLCVYTWPIVYNWNYNTATPACNNFAELLSSHSTLTARRNSSIFTYFVEPCMGYPYMYTSPGSGWAKKNVLKYAAPYSLDPRPNPRGRVWGITLLGSV